jgi:hypothetical protein
LIVAALRRIWRVGLRRILCNPAISILSGISRHVTYVLVEEHRKTLVEGVDCNRLEEDMESGKEADTLQ